MSLVHYKQYLHHANRAHVAVSFICSFRGIKSFQPDSFPDSCMMPSIAMQVHPSTPSMVTSLVGIWNRISEMKAKWTPLITPSKTGSQPHTRYDIKSTIGICGAVFGQRAVLSQTQGLDRPSQDLLPQTRIPNRQRSAPYRTSPQRLENYRVESQQHYIIVAPAYFSSDQR